ncbi:MAG TPA: Flp pilus assembly protein CpaB [Actinomycetota bacterium]|nr:Flp pilus assembly protein CpaB [Actinomycetota bacterium]
MFVRRWSLRSKAMAVLAVVAGAGSFTLVRGYAAEVQALRPTAGDLVPVVVADHDLTRGSVLDEGSVRLERMPVEYAPPGALRSIEQAAGRTLGSDLAEGEAVTVTRVGGAGGPVASLVSSGLRAFVVGSALPSGVLEPGDRVDVIATFGGPRPYSDTVGTGLEILSIVERDGETFQAGGATGPSLVLLVSPQTAEELARATAFGQITVTIASLDAV